MERGSFWSFLSIFFLLIGLIILLYFFLKKKKGGKIETNEKYLYEEEKNEMEKVDPE
jgi:hypothetical protein